MTLKYYCFSSNSVWQRVTREPYAVSMGKLRAPEVVYVSQAWTVGVVLCVALFYAHDALFHRSFVSSWLLCVALRATSLFSFRPPLTGALYRPKNATGAEQQSSLADVLWHPVDRQAGGLATGDAWRRRPTTAELNDEKWPTVEKTRRRRLNEMDAGESLTADVTVTAAAAVAALTLRLFVWRLDFELLID